MADSNWHSWSYVSRGYFNRNNESKYILPLWFCFQQPKPSSNVFKNTFTQVPSLANLPLDARYSLVFWSECSSEIYEIECLMVFVTARKKNHELFRLTNCVLLDTSISQACVSPSDSFLILWMPFCVWINGIICHIIWKLIPCSNRYPMCKSNTLLHKPESSPNCSQEILIKVGKCSWSQPNTWKVHCMTY